MPPQNHEFERARQLFDAGRHDEAEAMMVQALSAGQDSSDACRLRADIARARGRPAEEARALESLLALLGGEERMEAARAWGRLAVLRTRLGEAAAGVVAAWQSAVDAAPDVIEYRHGLVRAQFAAQDMVGARISAERLVQRFPREAFSQVFAGHVHKASGRRGQAADCYRQALELDAESGEALYNLVEMAGTDLDTTTRRRAMALAERNELPAADRINAAFAAARITDREGRYAEAFEYLRRANELARADLARTGIQYDPAAVEIAVTGTITAYPAHSFDAPLGDLPVDLVPIFVVGPPRSGTTLLEQILSSHSMVEAGGELLAARRTEFEFRQARAAAGRSGAIESSDTVDAGLLEDARERYVDALFERGLSGPYVVDKLPANFEIAGFLRLMFPTAPILHAVRDLRATGFSLYNANFGAHEPWKHDLDDLAHYLCQYRRLMAHWKVVLPGPCTEIVYEELVSDPGRQIPALLAAVGLDCEPACLDFHQQARPILTASYTQVLRPAYTDAVDHWRHYADWLGAVATLPAGPHSR